MGTRRGHGRPHGIPAAGKEDELAARGKSCQLARLEARATGILVAEHPVLIGHRGKFLHPPMLEETAALPRTPVDNSSGLPLPDGG